MAVAAVMAGSAIALSDVLGELVDIEPPRLSVIDSAELLQSMDDEQLRIPLVFWWPGRLAPARIDAASDVLDLHETLRRLAGAPPAAGGGGGRPEAANADGAQVMALGLLRGVQDTRVPMILAAVSYWVVGLPLGRVPGVLRGFLGEGGLQSALDTD